MAVQWVPLADIEVLCSGFSPKEALLDPAYPDGAENVPGSTYKYYATAFTTPTAAKPLRTCFKLRNAGQVCGIKVRGENYSRMQHMVKDMKLYCADDPEVGEGGAEGPWTEVASFTAEDARGWQMFLSQDVPAPDPQALCDLARDPSIRDMTALRALQAQGFKFCEIFDADESSPYLATHNGARCWHMPWNLSAAQYYRLDVLSNYGSYTALAEVNFLVCEPLVVCLFTRDEEPLVVECKGLDGSVRAELACGDDIDSLAALKRALAMALRVPFSAILPDGRTLEEQEDMDSFRKALAADTLP